MALLAAGSAQATTVLRFERDELARRATHVFEGTVIDVRAMRDDQGRIVTRVRFAVDAEGWWKGRGSAEHELCLPGGVLEGEGRALIVSGMPRFERGERALVFACETANGATRLSMPVGLKQGKFRVRAAQDGRRVLERELSGLELVDPTTRESSAAPAGAQCFDYEAWRAAVRRIAGGR